MSEREPVVFPTEFSLKELLEEAGMVAKSRRDFVEGKIAMGKMGREQANLERYSVARQGALVRFLQKLYDEERAARKAAPAAAPKVEPAPPPPPPAEEPAEIDDQWEM